MATRLINALADALATTPREDAEGKSDQNQARSTPVESVFCFLAHSGQGSACEEQARGEAVAASGPGSLTMGLSRAAAKRPAARLKPISAPRTTRAGDQALRGD